MRVMICNPRCVEVGLDFCFSELDALGNKVDYNYPTLIFYQCGYNLVHVVAGIEKKLQIVPDRGMQDILFCF